MPPRSNLTPYNAEHLDQHTTATTSSGTTVYVGPTPPSPYAAATRPSSTPTPPTAASSEQFAFAHARRGQYPYGVGDLLVALLGDGDDVTNLVSFR